MSKQLSSNGQRKVDALVVQMQQAFQEKKWDLCGQLCMQIEAWEPNNPETANVRGIVAVQSGDMQGAEHYFASAVNAEPENIGFQLNLGKLYLQQGVTQNALSCFQKAQQLKADDLTARVGEAECLLLLNQELQAYEIFKKLHQAYPQSNHVTIGLFRASFRLNRWEESEQYLQAMLALNPNDIEAHLGLVQLALQRGDFVAVEREALQCIALNPDLDLVYPMLATVKTFSHDDDVLIEQLQKYRQSMPKGSAAYMHLSFTLGKIMDDLSEHQRAFEYIEKANDIRYQNLSYDHDAEIAHLHAIVSLTMEQQVQTTSGLEDDTPIFIIGMPRCGSTMVEQILASHPNVESVGESNFFEAAVAELSDPKDPLTLEKMQACSSQQWQELGSLYLKKVREVHPDARYVVDKTLTNTRFVGAIHQALPHAKVIHVKRDALDTCWSIYKNNLLSPVYAYGFHLGQLGYYYRAYNHLMKHWADILPEGVMYEFNYEEMVQHQEIETLKLLSACHLESDDACFQFQKSKNVTITASQAQVRKPMYASSMGAAEPYKENLQVLTDILAR